MEDEKDLAIEFATVIDGLFTEDTTFNKASRDKIDNDGRLCFGKYSGKLVSTVARDDPRYLQWVLDEVEDLNGDDYRVIKAELKLKR